MSAKTSAEKKPINDLLKEKDAFLTTSERFYEYFLRHTKGFITAGIIVAVVIVGGALYSNFENSAQLKATEAYEQAIALVDDAAANAQAVAALEKVRADHAGRKGARMAGFALVKLYTGNNETDKALALAENLLQTITPDEISLKPLLLNTIGGLSENKGDWAKAAASYEAILSTNPMEIEFVRQVHMSLGRVYAAAGQKDKAIASYEKIVAEPLRSEFTFMANLKLAELKGQPAPFPLNAPLVPGIDTDLDAEAVGRSEAGTGEAAAAEAQADEATEAPAAEAGETAATETQADEATEAPAAEAAEPAATEAETGEAAAPADEADNAAQATE